MATTTQSLTVPAKDKAKQDCHCGCAPCDGSCCSLDCIVKPRFFCGQLLTDADLSALLKWSRDRFGLSRYRHGWGVVCGLDVRCDRNVPSGVIVTPGYAVDCCGDDIIICESAPLDLKGACREQEDPCADLRRNYEARGGVTAARPGLMPAVANANLVGTSEAFDNSMRDRLRVVDVYLNYDEQHSNPSTAMGRGSCKQVDECEYSRTREFYKLTYELGVMDSDSDPVSRRANRWHEGYIKCLEVLEKFSNLFGQNFPAADVRRWLLRWIDDHPEYQLCYLREQLCKEVDGFFTIQTNLVKVFFQLVQHCRNAYLNCDCFGCDEDARVPLARVWLLPDDRATGQACRIVAIDPYPPYRRPIQAECWPAPLGAVNVGRFIWHRWDEVCRAVDDLGLQVERREFSMPATLGALAEALKCDVFVKCGQRRVALVYRTELLGDRVVGFCETAVQPPSPKTNYALTVDKKSDKDATGARPDDKVNYFITVKNVGDGDFTDVIVDDAKIGPKQSLGPLLHGASRTIPALFVVPQGQSNPLENTVTAVGTSADGDTVRATATHRLTIIPPPPSPLVLQVKKRVLDPKTQVELTSAKPRDEVEYSFEVSNGSDVDLVVDVDDNLLGKVAAGVSIKAKQRHTPPFKIPFVVPDKQTRPITNKVTVVGRAADGRAMDAQDTHTLDILTCPVISVGCPSDVAAGAPITFTASVSGKFDVTYNWTVSAGTITSGQGTSSITVDTTDLGGQALTGTVEVGGLDPSCTRTGSCTTAIIVRDVAMKFDEFGDLKRVTEGDDTGGGAFADENARLDNFAIRLQSDPRAQGHVFVYMTQPNDAERIKRLQEYLIDTRGIAARRLTVVQVGRAKQLFFELWIVPEGAEPPRPTRAVADRADPAPPDNLTQIEEIGPKRFEKLKRAEITNFTALAATPKKRLKELFPGLKEEILAGWIEQAKKLTE